MNRLLRILAVTVFLSGCLNAKKPAVGGDKDSHGCIGSAGYTWCAQRGKCIRVWEEPCVSGGVINACYECDGLGKVMVDYYEGGFASLAHGGNRYRLERAVSASGARYTGNNVMIWDKSGKARLKIYGKNYDCVAK